MIIILGVFALAIFFFSFSVKTGFATNSRIIIAQGEGVAPVTGGNPATGATGAGAGGAGGTSAQPAGGNPAAGGTSAGQQQPVEAKVNTGSILGNALVNSALTVVWGILYIVLTALNFAVAYASDFLKFAILLNFMLPAQNEIILTLWTVARDIANSFFILLLLWIALTIIFDIEHLGGKKLLTRVIIIALLINFSMVMVTAAFGLGNAIAAQFAQKLPDDVGLFVTNAVKLQKIFEIPTQAGLNKLQQEADKQAQIQKAAATTAASNPPEPDELAPKAPAGGYIRNTFLASVGIQPAKAASLTDKLVIGGTVTVCAAVIGLGFVSLGAAFFLAPLCTYPATLLVGTSLLSSIFGDKVTYSGTVILLISVIFIFLAVSALIYAALALFLRVIMGFFLAVSSPIALMLYIVPNQKISRYANDWIDYLIRWAFFAPIFFFLFYMSLSLIGKFDALITQKVPVGVSSLDGLRFFQLTMAIFLFYYCGKFAKKGGGVVAETAMSWGKTAAGFALGTAVGGAATIAGRPLARALFTPEGRISRGLGRVAPYVPGAGALQRGTAAFMAKQREQIDKREKDFGNMSKDQTIAQARAAVSSIDRAALYKRIAREGWIEDYKNQYPGQTLKKRAVEHLLSESGKYGFWLDVLKQRPDLATEKTVPGSKNDDDALEIVLKKMKRQDMADIGSDLFADTPEMKEARQRIMRLAMDPKKKLFGPGHIEDLARVNPDRANMLIKDAIAAPKDAEGRDIVITPAIRQYLDTTAARGAGLLPLPAGAPESSETLITRVETIRKRQEQAMERIEDSRERAFTLQNDTTPGGRQDYSRTLRNLAPMENKIDRDDARANVIIAQMDPSTRTSVPQPLRITTDRIDDYSAAYSSVYGVEMQRRVQGGMPPHQNWTLRQPNGLNLAIDLTTGRIRSTGTPTVPPGEYAVIVKVEDNSTPPASFERLLRVKVTA